MNEIPQDPNEITAKSALLRLVGWVRKKPRRAVLYGLAGFGGLLFLVFVYCLTLLPELQQLMSQTPEHQPSVIYSDSFEIRKGAIYDNLFLKERLQELRIPFETKTEGDAQIIEWTERDFSYPVSLVPADSPGKPRPGSKVHIVVRDGLVAELAEREVILLEPIPIAQLTGTKTSVRDYLPLHKIPTKLLQAIIAVEDQRFLEHAGFDPKSILRAIWINLRTGTFSQGGSTVTQQLVKNLLGTREKTISRKVREVFLALLIEARYSKDSILEKYLNEVYFGQIGSLEVHGVAEAAKYFYGKSIEKLSLGEVALIAGVIRGPGVYSPYRKLDKALERKNVVLRKMFELQLITKTEFDEAVLQPLTFAPPLQGTNKAPYFADFVKAQVMEELGAKISVDDLSTQGLRIFTTADLFLQRKADSAVLSTVRDLEARFKIERPLRLEGLLVAADQSNGFVRALVGGRLYSETTFNRVLNMKRQVGSTFKPIVYLAAFQKGSDASGKSYTPVYWVKDEPFTYSYGRGKTWSPKNYENGYRGTIPLREAFVNSINIPLARIGTEIGLNNVVSTAKALGIEQPLAEVPSLSLGSIELTAMDLLRAYTTIANHGNRLKLIVVRAVTDQRGELLLEHKAESTQALDSKVVDLVAELLKGVVLEGTAKILPQLGYAKPTRGKTGTTSFSRDAWFAGFSQGLVTVSWVGFDELKVPDEEALQNGDEKVAAKFKSPAPLTGAGAALPIWARFYSGTFPSKLEMPDPWPNGKVDPALERERIDRSTGLSAKSTCPTDQVYEEVFLPNTAPRTPCTKH